MASLTHEGAGSAPCSPEAPTFPISLGELSALAKGLDDSQLSLDCSMTPLPVGGEDRTGTVQSVPFAS